MSVHALKNPEKKDREFWKDGDDLLNFPAPFTMLLCGMKSCGKTNMIKNLILKQKPEFDTVWLLSADPEGFEYSDMLQSRGAHLIPRIPSIEEIDREGKKLLIIEDIEFQSMNKMEHGIFQELICHSASHRNLSIVITGHDYILVPKILRRTADIVFIFRQNDPTSLETIMRKVGVPKAYHKVITLEGYQCLVSDKTYDSPARYRMNGYDPLPPLI